MKICKCIVFFFYLLTFYSANAQCVELNYTDVSFSPQKSVYCIGDDLVVTLSTSMIIHDLTFTFANATSVYTTAMNVLHIDGITGSGLLNISGVFLDPSLLQLDPQNPVSCGGLPELEFQIDVSPPLVADAGPDINIGGNPSFGNIGGNPTGSGGTPPLTYAWSPNNYFVNSSSNLDPNPDVAPPVSTNYNVIVTDAYGCNASDVVAANIIVWSCPPDEVNNISVSPIKSVYCPGDNLTINFLHGWSITNLNFDFSGGAGSTYTTGTAVFHIDGIASDGVITVSGQIIDPVSGRPCDFDFSFVLNVSPALTADAGSNILISGNPAFTQIGGNPTANGGTPPLTYLWSPNSYYVNSTNQSQANPQVNPPNGTIFNLLVTDITGCTSSDNVTVYNASGTVQNKSYAILKKELDAGYHQSINNGSSNFFYFKFDEEYYVAPNNNLSFKLFDNNGVIVSGITPQLEKIGDNRFSINLNSTTAGFYILKVYNQKNESWQSRIKIN